MLRGGPCARWMRCAALLVCVAVCDATRYDYACPPFLNTHFGLVAPGASTPTTTGSWPTKANSGVIIYCFGTMKTGCDDGVMAAAHLAYFATGTTTPVLYPVSEAIDGPVYLLRMGFAKEGYFTIQYHKGLTSDGDVCAADGVYEMQWDYSSELLAAGVIVDASPRVIVPGSDVELVLQAPPDADMEVYDGLNCDGKVVGKVGKGERGPVTVRLPPGLAGQYVVCTHLNGGTSPAYTANFVNLFSPTVALYVAFPTPPSEGKRHLSFDVYHKTIKDGSKIKMVGYYDPCTVDSVDGIGEAELVGKTECSMMVWKGNLTLPDTVDPDDMKVCLWADSKWLDTLALSERRPAVRSFVLCGYTNACQGTTTCPSLTPDPADLPTSPDPTDAPTDTPDHKKSGVSTGVVVASVCGAFVVGAVVVAIAVKLCMGKHREAQTADTDLLFS